MPGSTTRPLVASYRFQLTPTLGFDDVAVLLDAVRQLGISHVYLSPIAEAIPGSQHGYDVVDHCAVRSDFGGETGLERLLDRAAALELGVVVDHVPNHVSVARAELNPRWWAMLRDGPDSPAADWFDVDWEPTGGKVVVPKLAEPTEQVLAAGGIELSSGRLGPELRVGTLRFPLAEGTEHLTVADAIESQHYRLTWWRDPTRNVRRFFTIDDLVAVRVELDSVAASVDTLPRRLCDHPAFAGVRVDHVDGLADPQGYLDGLRETIGDRWLLVEKILGPGEYLPGTWPVDGTTGYEHVTFVEHVLLDPAELGPIDGQWREVVAADGRLDSADFDRIERSARVEVLDGGLAPDLQRLVRSVTSEAHIGAEAARESIVVLTLALDRYRTYLPDDDRSARVLDAIEQEALARRPDLAEEIRAVAGLIRRDEVVRTRWQQLTGPVMAKGAEDRAFYRHQRLSSLCEVGGRPGVWTIDAVDFHTHQRRVQAEWPTTMLTATTHDTKRSEAVRARSLALAAMADDWVEAMGSWSRHHRDVTTGVHPVDVLLAWQTAATASPLTVDRLHEYLVKATREAELATDWHDPDLFYEAGLRRLASALIDETADPSTPMAGLIERIERRGARIGLGVLALQLTCPGVPDLFQGAPAELLSLVDPDNRRPPDWRRWRRLVERSATRPDAPLDPGEPDLARTRLVRRMLDVRRRRPDAFGPAAGYVVLDASGPSSERILAFARTDVEGRPAVAVVVARPVSDRTRSPDAEVALPAGRWRNLVDGSDVEGASLPVSSLVGDVGVAVLAAAE